MRLRLRLPSRFPDGFPAHRSFYACPAWARPGFDVIRPSQAGTETAVGIGRAGRRIVGTVRRVGILFQQVCRSGAFFGGRSGWQSRRGLAAGRHHRHIVGVLRKRIRLGGGLLRWLLRQRWLLRVGWRLRARRRFLRRRSRLRKQANHCDQAASNYERNVRIQLHLQFFSSARRSQASLQCYDALHSVLHLNLGKSCRTHGAHHPLIRHSCRRLL